MVYVFIFLVLFISFFILYILSKNDFVLIRKNISLTSLFDKAFLALVTGFLVGRVLYIFDTTRLSLFYYLSFFHVLKYPGISLLGVFLGLPIPLIFFRKKKVVLRACDIFALSFFFLFPLSILFRTGILLTTPIKAAIIAGSLLFFSLLLFFHKKYTFHDGTISVIILLLIALDTFFAGGIIHHSIFSLQVLQWVSIVVIMITIFLLFYNERMRKRS